jgi:hypothetical protein
MLPTPHEAPEANLASEEPAAVPAAATGVDEYGLPTAPGSKKALHCLLLLVKSEELNIFCPVFVPKVTA